MNKEKELMKLQKQCIDKSISDDELELKCNLLNVNINMFKNLITFNIDISYCDKDVRDILLEIIHNYRKEFEDFIIDYNIFPDKDSIKNQSDNQLLLLLDSSFGVLKTGYYDLVLTLLTTCLFGENIYYFTHLLDKANLPMSISNKYFHKDYRDFKLIEDYVDEYDKEYSLHCQLDYYIQYNTNCDSFQFHLERIDQTELFIVFVRKIKAITYMQEKMKLTNKELFNMLNRLCEDCKNINEVMDMLPS